MACDSYLRFISSVLSCKSQNLLVILFYWQCCEDESGMSLRDYLHKKAEESRHNETLGFLILIIGVITVPYKLDTHLYSLLGLSLTSIGLTLLILGIAFSTHSAWQRTMYIDRLKEAQQDFETKVVEPAKKKQKR